MKMFSSPAPTRCSGRVWVVLLALAGAMLWPTAGAFAAADLVLTIGSGTGPAGGQSTVDVDLVATAARPASVSFQVLYDSGKLTVQDVQAGSIVTDADKQVAWAVPTAGTLNVVVSGAGGSGVLTELADGTLAGIVFSIYSGATVGEVIPVEGNAADAAEPDDTRIDSEIVDGDVTVVACVAPDPPTGVSASDGTYGDRVRVTWMASTGASSYWVFRNSLFNPNGATPLGQVTGTFLDDFSAAAATAAGGGGCGGAAGLSTTPYYYWVVATNVCGNSGYGGGDVGYRGQAKAAQTELTAVPVIPETGPGEFIAQDTPLLAVRLDGEEGIDPGSVWGYVTGEELDSEDVAWIADDMNATGGWVVFRPGALWFPGELVTMIAGAATVSGDSIGPVQYTFAVESDALESAKSRTADALLRHPDASSMGLAAEASDVAVLTELPVTVAPPPARHAIGPAYRIGPDTLFDTPQRVWVPVPDGYAVSDVEIYRHVGAHDAGAWYPAENVSGWMVPGSALAMDVAGASYIGLFVRHGAVVQLAAPEVSPVFVEAGTGAFGRLGDAVLFTLLAGILVLTGRVKKRWNPTP